MGQGRQPIADTKDEYKKKIWMTQKRCKHLPLHFIEIGGSHTGQRILDMKGRVWFKWRACSGKEQDRTEEGVLQRGKGDGL
jgi:hypothetical protein